MFTLDVRTLTLLVAFICMLCAINMVLQYHLARDYSGIGWWAGGSIAIASGFGLILFRGILPDFLSIIVANVINVIGVICFEIGTARFFSLPYKQRYKIGAVVVFITVITFLYFTYYQNDINIRIAIIALIAIILLSRTSWMLLRSAPVYLTQSAFVSAIALMGYTVFSAVRIILALEFTPITSYFTPNVMQIGAPLIVLFTIALWTFASSTMITQRRMYDLHLSQEREHTRLRQAAESARQENNATQELLAQLKASDTRYRLLARHLPNLTVLLFDHDLRCTLAEGVHLAYLGRVEHAEGKTLPEIMPPELAIALEPYYRSALDGTSGTIEIDSIHHSYRVQCVPLLGEQNTIIGGMITAEDITDRKQAGREIQQRVRHQQALSSCSQVLLQSTRSPEERQANIQTALHYLREGTETLCVELFRHIPDSGTGRRAESLACSCGIPHPGGIPNKALCFDWINLPSDILHGLEAGNSVCIPSSAIFAPETHADGSLHFCPIHSNGQLWGYVVFSERANAKMHNNPDHLLQRTASEVIGNVIQRWEVEQVLLESEARYRSVITAMAEGIVFQSADGSIQTCNNAAEQILGLTVDQMVGRSSIDPLWRAIHEDGNPFPGSEHPAMVSLRTGEAHRDVVMGVYKPDGSLTWILINTQPLVLPGETRPYAVVASFNDITRQREAALALEALLADKDVLLKEVHHRVKNNLQVIVSLLRLQAGTINDPIVIEQFRETQNRVRAMALVHEQLYSASDLTRVSIAEYVKMLAGGVLRSYTIQAAQIELRIDISADVRLTINSAVPFGLVLTEILTNSVKYAFPKGQRGNITITASTTDTTLLLIVHDDGIGLPDHFDLTHASTLGLQLVRRLVQQMRGTVTLSAKPGTTYQISIPVSNRPVNRAACASVQARTDQSQL